MNTNEKEILNFARQNYGFLVGNATCNNGELADAIEEYYDLDNPQNKAIYNTLKKYSDLTGIN